MDRIAEILDNLIGIESPDDLMLEILEALSETEGVPEAGNYYTFVYQPKTPGIQYDEFPLVAVTDVYNWGFKGLNFHWGNVRQYTWQEVVGNLHTVTSNEIESLRGIPYGKIRLNN
tara:strand:+ start:102 stop:449 length:348 start_codon:yes stop_codon:yes gene_type:complete